MYYICIDINTKIAMSKTRQKKANYNEEIILALISKYGFKRDYIYKSIRGERVGTIPIKIQEEYKTLSQAAKNAIKTKLEDI